MRYTGHLEGEMSWVFLREQTLASTPKITLNLGWWRRLVSLYLLCYGLYTREYCLHHFCHSPDKGSHFSCLGIPMTPCSICAVRFFTLAKNDPNCVLQQTLPTEVLTAVRCFIAATSQWKDCKVEQSPKILMIMLCSTFGPGFQNYFLHGYLPGYYIRTPQVLWDLYEFRTRTRVWGMLM